MSSSSYWAYNSPVYPVNVGYFNPHMMVNPGEFFTVPKQMPVSSDAALAKQGPRRNFENRSALKQQTQSNSSLPASKRERVVIKVVDPVTNEDLTTKLAEMYDAVNTRASTPEKETQDELEEEKSLVCEEANREPIKPFFNSRDKAAVQRVEPQVCMAVPSAQSPKIPNKKPNSTRLPEVTCILNENKEIVQVFSDSSAVIEELKSTNDTTPKEQFLPSSPANTKQVHSLTSPKKKNISEISLEAKKVESTKTEKSDAILPKSATWGNKFSKVNQKTPIAAAIVKPMPVVAQVSSPVSNLDDESYPNIVTKPSSQSSGEYKPSPDVPPSASNFESHLTPSSSTSTQKLCWSSAMKRNSPNPAMQPVESSELKFNFVDPSPNCLKTQESCSSGESATSLPKQSKMPIVATPPAASNKVPASDACEPNAEEGTKETEVDDDGFQEVKQKRKPTSRQTASFRAYKQSSNSVPFQRSDGVATFGDGSSRGNHSNFKQIDREGSGSYNSRGRSGGRRRWTGNREPANEERENGDHEEVETTILPSFQTEKQNSASTSWADEVESSERSKNTSSFSWSKIVKSGANKPTVFRREAPIHSDQPAWAQVEIGPVKSRPFTCEDQSSGPRDNWRNDTGSGKPLGRNLDFSIQHETASESVGRGSSTEGCDVKSVATSAYPSRRRDLSPEESGKFDRLVSTSQRSQGKISTFSRSPSPRSNVTDKDDIVTSIDRRRNDSKGDKSRPVNIVNPMKYDD